MYRCPICKAKTKSLDKRIACEAGHSFDVAKEGYVNLLPVQNKHSKQPGDNQQMISARRNFLEAGHYQLLSDRVNEIAFDFIEKSFLDSNLDYGSDSDIGSGSLNSLNILDVGCGEGYYSYRLFDYLQTKLKKPSSENIVNNDSADDYSTNDSCNVANSLVDGLLSNITLNGLDISKSAIKYAAKRYENLAFCVASSYEMPFFDFSFDLLLRIYSPSKLSELHRVMRDKAFLITVSPATNHHYSIKQMIYATPQPHEMQIEEIDGLVCVHQEQLTSKMILKNSTDINNFLNMTPYSWKLTEAQKLELSESELNCELDFHIVVYQKNDKS